MAHPVGVARVLAQVREKAQLFCSDKNQQIQVDVLDMFGPCCEVINPLFFFMGSENDFLGEIAMGPPKKGAPRSPCKKCVFQIFHHNAMVHNVPLVPRGNVNVGKRLGRKTWASLADR